MVHKKEVRIYAYSKKVTYTMKAERFIQSASEEVNTVSSLLNTSYIKGKTNEMNVITSILVNWRRMYKERKIDEVGICFCDGV